MVVGPATAVILAATYSAVDLSIAHLCFVVAIWSFAVLWSTSFGSYGGLRRSTAAVASTGIRVSLQGTSATGSTPASSSGLEHAQLTMDITDLASPEITPADEIDWSFQATVEDINHRSLSTLDDANRKQVILVVASGEDEYSDDVVESLRSSLKKDGEWTCQTKAGVRIHECISRIIVHALPLRIMEVEWRCSGGIARQWISRNGLRRILFREDVGAVCVVLLNNRSLMYPSAHQRWMEFFNVIFKPISKAVIIHAKMENSISRLVPEAAVKKFVQNHGFLTENIIFSSGEKTDTSLGKAIEERISLSRMPSKATIIPFPTHSQPSRRERYIWGPERMILFGRAGSGKSTLAQMLAFGDLDPENKKFVTSSIGRGQTTEIEGATGRGWYVLDTPGFGEPDDPDSTIKTSTVKRMLEKYVALQEGVFSHYVYVLKAGRVDDLDTNLWEFFKNYFGKKITFSVVVSGQSGIDAKAWIEAEGDKLKDSWGCRNLFAADFAPAPDLTEDLNISQEEWKREFQKVRKESLEVLEEELAKLGLVDICCRTGESSEMNIANDDARASVEYYLESSEDIKFRLMATRPMIKFHHFVTRSLVRVSEWLDMHDNVPLERVGGKRERR